jgi:hypothetical protein
MKEYSLYWTSTPCNLENWFIVATSEKKAKHLHDDGEGFDRGYSRAKYICPIPNDLLKSHHNKDESHWPTLELLEALGFKIIDEEFPRIVSHNSKMYREGGGIVRIAEEQISKFPGLYIINISNTDKYKIGYTKNLSSRLKAFRTALPFPIQLRFYIVTPHYRELEKETHQILFSNRVRGEWFTLNEEDINELKEKFNSLDEEKFHVVDYTDFPRY